MQHTRDKIPVVVILGPTATGKSDLAVFLAQKFNGEVVSADSRQVYRGLDIGSGKITKREMGAVPHYMIDIASPKRTISAAQYRVQAQKAIQKIAKKNKLPILCGGSGFYIDAVLDNISLSPVPPNPRLRKKLSQQPIEKLYEILQTLDPKHAEKIDRKNPRRVVRALEIVNAQGKVVSLKTREHLYETVFIGLTLPKEQLAEKIRMRLRKRFKQGMVNEVKHLHADGVSWQRLESLGLEYREIAKYLQKKMGLSEMKQHLEIAIRQFSKRQMTWFKRNKNIQWFAPDEREKISDIVAHFLDKRMVAFYDTKARMTKDTVPSHL